MKKKTLLLSLGGIAAFALASCSPNEATSSDKSVDSTVASIKIVEGSIASTYTIGQTVDYSKLSIQTLNAAKEVISTLKASENTTDITYTNIDTSKIVSAATFTVTYKNEFEATMTYAVNDIEYELSSWAANANYTATVSTKGNSKLSKSEDELENGFVQDGKYYIGNDNAVDLLPIINAINPDDLTDIKILDEMPSNVTIALKDSTGTALNVEDCLENTSELKTKGLVKFKDTVTGKYTLTFSSTDLPDNSIYYEMNVVDAYNVTKAVDLFALDNAKVGDNLYGDSIRNHDELTKKYKTDNNLPYAQGLVFQNDVSIGKSDVPSFYLWGNNDKPTTTVDSIKGSLRDWNGYINYSYTKNGEKVNIYGNCHKLALKDSGDDAFPYIVTDDFANGSAQEANKPISSHASLFRALRDEALTIDTSTCEFNVQDLEVSGNMGVSNESTITKGGPMFIKSQVTSKLENVNASKVYMAYMVDGYENKTCSANIKDCRFRDLFNAGIYAFKNGTLDIDHSELVKAGGPLVFLNPLCQVLPSDGNLASLEKTSVTIDNSFMSNYTEGKGGWFAAYEGAEAIAAQLKTMDQLLNAQCQTTFLKTSKSTSGDSNVQKFDFRIFSLPTTSAGGESLGAIDESQGGVNVDVKIDGKLAYSTLDGYAETMSAFAAYAQDQTNQEKGLAYVNKLATTDFGNGLAYATTTMAVTFRRLDANGVPQFAIINQKTVGDQTQTFLCDSKYAILGGMGYNDATLSALGLSINPNDVFKTANDYITLSINPQGKTAGATTAQNFKGTSAYGVIFGGYNTLAA